MHGYFYAFGMELGDILFSTCLFQLGIEFYLFVSHGGMKRQRVHV